MPLSGSTVAPGIARLGVARLGAIRLGGVQPILKVTISGTTRTSYIRANSLTIRDNLNGIPNTAILRVSGFVPTKGQEIKIGLGNSVLPTHLIFAGHILQVTQLHRPLSDGSMQLEYDLSCISYEWLLNRRTVSAKYTSTSASSIVTDLMTTYTSGFTLEKVEGGLDSLDEITFTNESVTNCLDRIAKRIGAEWVVDYEKRLHFGNDVLSTFGTPQEITDSDVHGLIAVKQTTDLSQVRTRVLVEGNGSTAAADVDAGTTTLPVDDTTYFDTGGGTVACGSQRVIYSGVSTGGDGALVGSTVTPSNAPSLVLTGGSGVTAGVHGYAVTFYTGAGETLPGPSASISVGAAVSAPASAPTARTGLGDGGLTNFATYTYTYTFYNPATGQETTPSPVVTESTADEGQDSIEILTSSLQAAPSGCVRRWYRSEGNGSTRYLMKFNDGEALFTVLGNGYLRDTASDGFTLNLAVTEPVSNTMVLSRVAHSSIPIGPSGTTGRKLYRTAAGGSQLKLLATIADNTTATYTDSTADGSLGANVPTSDTSGLTAASGTVNAGSTSVPVTSTAPFRSGGGWATAAGELFAYSGLSSTALTGVPSAGSRGALTVTLNYGTEVLSVPMLTGIAASGDGSIRYAINKGDGVQLVAIRDDVDAQAVLAALDGTDGIVEDYIQDRRLSQSEAEARGDARLEEVADPVVSMSFQIRNQNVRAGKVITFTRTAEALNGDFKIQSVVITGFDSRTDGTCTMWPIYQAEASSRRFTFEQLLQQIKGT